jgi:chemotaxis protein CheY-P-specific phosphatase CheC
MSICGMRKNKTITTDDILVTLCQSFTEVLSSASGNKISYSAMVQKISRTCLRPDIGCFVLFDGGFSGIVVANFTAPAAMEIYRDYMKTMGMPDEEIACNHMSDDVSNIMGELMNQMVGDFTGKVREQLQTSITQNQPKMMVLNKLVQISVDTAMDRPQARRVTFTTKNQNIFYLELAMDKTEFIQLHDIVVAEKINPDDIIHQENNKPQDGKNVAVETNNDVDDDFLAELGL